MAVLYWIVLAWLYWNVHNTVFSLKRTAISNTWFLGPNRVLNENGTFIASAVFAELNSVTDRHTILRCQ